MIRWTWEGGLTKSFTKCSTHITGGVQDEFLVICRQTFLKCDSSILVKIC